MGRIFWQGELNEEQYELRQSKGKGNKNVFISKLFLEKAHFCYSEVYLLL